MAKSIINQLLEHGNIQRGLFGVEVRSVTPNMVDLYELPTREGALVVRVFPGSSAEQAGIQVEDVIVSVNSEEIADASDLQNELGLQRIGDEFELTLVRDGRQKTFRTAIAAIDTGLRVAPDDTSPLHGVTLSDIPSTNLLYLQVSGLLVFEIDVNSQAYEAGLRSDDIILRINRRPVSDLQNTDERLLNQNPLFLHVLRDRAQFIIVLQ